MTDGTPDKTAPWVKKLNPRYGHAYDRTGFAYRQGVRVYPAAVLVAPNGVVLWKGHPSGLKEELIEKHLPAAEKKPLFKWPTRTAALKKALKARDWTLALKEAATLAADDEEDREFLAATQRFIAREIDAVNAMVASGDALDAWTIAHRLRVEFATLAEPLAKIDAIIQAAGKVEGFRESYLAQKTVRDEAAKVVSTKVDAKKVIEVITAVARKHDGTVAAREAAIHAQYLQAMIDLEYLK